MIIKENDILNNMNILEQMNQLYENEMTFPAAVIPVIHNKRTNHDLIQLESFLKFGKYNNITDGSLAVFNICEANNITMNNIGFIVNEESLYEDPEIADTYIQLCEYNFPMYVAPISKHSIYSMKLNEALILDEDCLIVEESEHILNYCLFPLDESAEDTVKSVAKKLAAVKKELSNKINQLKTETNSKAKVMLNNQINKLKSSADFLKNKLSKLSS